ncbi:MAG: hypothetical protein J6L70_04255 [Alphaproteobacteria bacterium]|nr:hypothetical protein [Alphaproteobacteria bacterium]
MASANLLQVLHENSQTKNLDELVQELQELEKDATYPTDKEKEDFLAEFYEAYEAAKEKEQSFANRMLGGLAIGASGIGGMQMASAMAEQNADADAERDMRAYLATFHCNYGDGQNIKYGETNIELPGAAELIPLYAEYVTLANDLKTRKEQLGMKPGIESEPILNSATTGLYDDVAVDKTSGAYTSLARALQNPNGEDAKKWSETRDEIAKKLKTGAIVGGVGIAGGAVGNVLINHTDTDIEKTTKQKKLSTRGKK